MAQTGTWVSEGWAVCLGKLYLLVVKDTANTLAILRWVLKFPKEPSFVTRLLETPGKLNTPRNSTKGRRSPNWASQSLTLQANYLISNWQSPSKTNRPYIVGSESWISALNTKLPGSHSWLICGLGMFTKKKRNQKSGKWDLKANAYLFTVPIGLALP